MGRPATLVERERQLRALEEVFDEPSEGSVILVSGEAGHGKTSLIQTFLEGLDHRYEVLAAACEPLGIPAAFAPLFELVDDVPTDLAADIRSASGRLPVYAGMLDLLKNERIVLVLEDLHWADEATLGLARYLGRRIASTDSRLILSFRAEDLDINPRLRLVVADLGSAATRIDLPALSREAVGALAAEVGADPDQVYEATSGNPFFVEEVLSDPSEELPPSIQDAVLANVERLPEPAIEVLQLIALSPDGLGADVLAELGDPDGSLTDLAFQRRLVSWQRDHITCRHELIRRSLVNALPPALSRRLHGRLLFTLEERRTDSTDVARLAYHSTGAGEGERALDYSLQAAHQASHAGAHREAAFHFDNALDHAPMMSRPVLLKTLLIAAQEHLFVNHFEKAVELSRRRLQFTDDPVEEAKARAWVAHYEARLNDYSTALIEAERANEVLQHQPPSEERALGLNVAGSVKGYEGRIEDSIELNEEALEVARAVGAKAIEVKILTTLGTRRWALGDPRGREMVEDAVELGVAISAGEYPAGAMNNMGYMSFAEWELSEARTWFERLREYCSGNELDAWYMAAVVTLASIAVEAAEWDKATSHLETVWGQKTCYSSEIEVLTSAARLRIRRGDPGAEDLATTAMARAAGFAGADETEAVAMMMEAAWVGVVTDSEAAAHYASLLSRLGSGQQFDRSLLAYWAYRLGWELPDGMIEGPPALELGGSIAEAALDWDRRGFQVQALIASATMPGADLDAVFARLTSMGADGVMRGLRRELERRGARRIPRGRRKSTRQNPAGLTNREMEVLQLLVDGRSNAGIANELYISEKTAGHHVSAVLAKVGCSTRGEAAALAVTNEWATPN